MTFRSYNSIKGQGGLQCTHTSCSGSIAHSLRSSCLHHTVETTILNIH